MVLIYCQILKTNIKRNIWQSLERINHLTFATEATVDSSSSASSPNDNKLKFLLAEKNPEKTCCFGMETLFIQGGPFSN